MQVSKLKTIVNLSLNDILPALDIDGGVSGKPILGKTTIQSIIDLLPDVSGGSGNSSGGFSILTTIKTVAANNDYFIGIDVDGLLYRISKADLLAGLTSSSGSGGSGSGGSGSGSSGSSGSSRTFANSGDNNGLFYYLGTSLGTLPWSNPSGNGLIISASAVESGTLSLLVDKQGSQFWTPSVANNWVSFSLTKGKLTCNYYSIKSRISDVDYYPRNWKLQGSNDNSSWTDLDTQTNNASLNSIDQWLSLPVTTADSYSSFRLLTTGVNSSNYYHLCLGKVELYGLYIH